MRIPPTITALALSLATLSGGAYGAPVPVAPHERLLPLRGGRNFRDLGGYRTGDGRTVKWGMLFRSGSMHGLTPGDYIALQQRGIRVVCDFRDTRERAAEPVNWPAADAPRMLSDDYQLDMAGLMPTGERKSWTAERTRAAMAASYPRMLVQFRGQYRRMFAELLAGNAPLAFNCSAGKDRTGIAAALLLTALGVPRETVIGDYLLTNRYLDTATLLDRNNKATASGPWSQVPPEVMKPMLAADRDYIGQALAVLDAHSGGAEGWLRDEMGLSQTDLLRLGTAYLE